MIALFSIKPEFVEKIFSGEKKFEYRKSIFKNKVDKIVVYSTKPVGMIVGEFNVSEVLEDNPNAIWDKTNPFAGIKKAFFDRYFKNRKKCYAINIGHNQLYEKAINPHDVFESFSPPQSFRYLSEEDYSICQNNAFT